MTRRGLLIGGVVVAFVIGVIVLVLSMQYQSEISRANLSTALAGRAAVTGTTAAQFATGTSNAIRETQIMQTLTRQLGTPTRAPVALDPGFRASLPEGNTISADGTSRLRINLTTYDPSVVGKDVIFLVYGGGRVDPPQTQLLPVDQPLDVYYVAGRAQTTVNIDIVINETGQRVSLVIETSSEDFQLSGYPNAPARNVNGALTIPVTLRLEPTGSQALLGAYTVDLQALRGLIAVHREGNTRDAPASRVSYTFDQSHSTLLVDFISNQQGEDGLLLASVPNRDDVAALEVPVYFDSAGGMRFLDHNAWLSRYPQERICVYVWDIYTRLMQANAMRVRYTPLLLPNSGTAAQISFNQVLAQPGSWIDSSSGLRPEVWQTLEHCLIPQFNNGTTGLLNLELEGDNSQARVSRPVALYYQAVSFRRDNPIPMRVEMMDGQLGTLLLPAYTWVRGYTLQPVLSVNTPILLPLYAPPEAIDANGALSIPPGQLSLTLYTEQAQPVIVDQGRVPRTYVMPPRAGETRREVFLIIYDETGAAQLIVPSPTVPVANALPTSFDPQSSIAATPRPTQVLSATWTLSPVFIATPTNTSAPPIPPSLTPTDTSAPPIPPSLTPTDTSAPPIPPSLTPTDTSAPPMSSPTPTDIPANISTPTLVITFEGGGGGGGG